MPGRVLDGIRVLDLTRVVAGPFATLTLADLGAEIIKIERPGTGDDYRYGPSRKGETSLSFQNCNRGKRSITLDLHDEEGRDLFLRLVEGADVVVENFRAGWLASQGLGAEVLQTRNPRCVVASLSGFGATGPRAGLASYDIVAQATGGLMALTGEEGGDPMRGGGALADFVGGLYLALGIVAALRDRDRTGRARVLDLSNQDCIFAITDSAVTIHAGIGQVSKRVGNQHPFTAPYDAFHARDGWVVIATASNRLFKRLCRAIGREEIATDARFRSHRDRAARRTEINAIVGEWVGQLAVDEVLAALGPEGADVPCARVSSPEELVDDPQLQAREMIERHAHPRIGEVLFHGNPLKLSGTEPREIELAPELGADNDRVFTDLGLTDEDIERLRGRGVI
ncbi:MAG: CoA transferase [Myxococcota bacterium]|nr:CoA transferase [Myxococcota bacterium]